MSMIDQNLVFFDCAEVATAESEEVPLNYLYRPGRMDPIPVYFKILGDPTGVSSIDVELQESEEQGGAYTPVSGGSFSLSGADIVEGRAIVFRWIPPATAKQWLKLKMTVGGSASADPAPAIFAAVMREDELPYTDGMYIDRGVVKG